MEEAVLDKEFWATLDTLIRSADLVIDRPKGSAHPRYPSLVYPLDYGYLKGTTSGDGHELDAWRGSRAQASLDAVVCSVDLYKKDVEVKLLLGCTRDERKIILDFHNNSETMAAILVMRSAP